MTINLSLAGLGPFMKAIAPALLALIGAGVNALATGKIDQQTLVIAATGLLAAVVAYLVPNTPKTPVAPAPAPAPVRESPMQGSK